MVQLFSSFWHFSGFSVGVVGFLIVEVHQKSRRRSRHSESKSSFARGRHVVRCKATQTSAFKVQ